jgi:3-hydroxyacyl-[acyl-carrier-protein] dehydratase
MPLVPGVLLIETMAQASGMLVLAATDFSAMPFLMSVDGAKMRTFVEPEAVLDIEAFLEHDGSGFAVTKAKITSNGKKVCDAQLKLRTVPFSEVPLGDIVRKRAGEVGLMDAIAAQGANG